MTEHTPGPWIIDNAHTTEDGGSGYFELTAAALGKRNEWDDKRVVILDGCEEVNARLIAAAPDLLVASRLALKRLSELNRDDELGMRMVLANAIAKADGRDASIKTAMRDETQR